MHGSRFFLHAECLVQVCGDCCHSVSVVYIAKNRMGGFPSSLGLVRLDLHHSRYCISLAGLKADFKYLTFCSYEEKLQTVIQCSMVYLEFAHTGFSKQPCLLPWAISSKF